MKIFFGLLLLLLVSTAVSAQTLVSGTVTDTDGMGLIGATVLVKGTSAGTVTDLDGRYSVTVPEGSETLVVTYTGYETIDIPINGQTQLDVTLSEGVALDEVVVTGYAVTSKRKTTGAISTIDSEELTAIPSGNVEQQFQGRAPGVTVVTNGQPGTSSIVRIRGFGSFGGNDPLYVVDGIQVGSSDFINPSDIQNTTILKDAAATSIYGARAAGGVIVIQTKRGERSGPQPLQVSYEGLVGFTDPGNGQDILTPQQDADKTWEALRNDGLSPGDVGWGHPQYGDGATPVLPDFLLVGPRSGVIGSLDLDAERELYNIDAREGSLYQVVRANKEGTDWYDALTRTGSIQRHSLGFRGATDDARYYLGVSAQLQEGIVLNNDFRRYTARLNTSFDIGDHVRIGENLQLTYRATPGQFGGGGGRGLSNDENAILSAFRMNPIIPVFDEFGGYAGTAARGFNNPSNPVAEREGIENNRAFNTGIFGNFFVEVEPLENLTFRSTFGGSYGNFTSRSFGRQTYENSENNGSFSYFEASNYGYSWQLTNTVNYKRTFGIHGIDVLLGQEAISSGNGAAVVASGINPFIRDPNFINLNTVQPNPPSSEFFVPVKFASYFGQVNYDLNDRYYVTGVVRRDGSSRFGANNRYGVFPAFSAAWRISGEDFMQGQTIFQDLKLRAGWGQVGNSNNVSAVNRFSLFDQNINEASYPISGSNTTATPGFRPSRIGTENAQWETSETTNIGLEANMLRGKLDFEIDVWRKNTIDLLLPQVLPDVAGEAAAPFVNAGEMLNEGIDFGITYRSNFTQDLKFSVNVNGSVLRNEIVSYVDDVEFLDFNGSRINGPIIRNQVGQPLSTFFGYRVLGLFQSQAEIDAAPEQVGASPGRFRLEDNNSRDEEGELTGVPDGIVDEADRTFLGSAIPDFTGGLGLGLDYRNFTFDAFFYTSIGNEIYNNSKWFTDFFGTFRGAAVSSRVLDSWSPDNPNASVPIYESTANVSTGAESVSYYVEDGSYLRLQRIALGYKFPANAFGGFFEGLRVTVDANNLFTITNYEGLDPAVGGEADTRFGVDVGNYPVTRSFNFRVNVTF